MSDSESLISGQTMHRTQSSGAAAPGNAQVPQGDDRYEVISVLGEGGMGRVVEAIDKQFSRVVAIKELRTADGDGARLQTEAVVTGNLEHPGVPAVYERGVRADGAPYYVMRRVRGRSLEDVLADAKDLDARMEQLPALTRAAQTLGFAHEKGVVHRDIKPQNIMVGSHGEVFVVDWGLARAGNLAGTGSSSSSGDSSVPAPQKTMMGAVMGTPAYMAPEQARGDVAMINARTDVFALGAVLYRMLAGTPPYSGTDTAQVLEKARRGEFTDLDVAAPNAAAPLKEICRRAMARDADKRFPTAQHLADALESFASVAVSKAYEKDAGRSALAVLLFGIFITLLGLLGIGRLAPQGTLLTPNLAIGLAFFFISLRLAWLESKTSGKARLAPFGYGAAATLPLTGFIAVGFSILGHAPNWERGALQGAVGLAVNSLMGAMALGVWGFVLFRRKG